MSVLEDAELDGNEEDVKAVLEVAADDFSPPTLSIH